MAWTLFDMLAEANSDAIELYLTLRDLALERERRSETA